MRAEAPEPSIRGSYIGPSKAWIRETYGVELWEKGLRALPASEQALYRSEIVSVEWYPLRQWTALLAAVRDGVLVATGEDGKTFDKRHLYESISGTMQTVYRIAFALLSTTTIVAKGDAVFQTRL